MSNRRTLWAEREDIDALYDEIARVRAEVSDADIRKILIKSHLIAKDDEPAKGQEGREPFGSVAKGKRGRCEV